MGTYIFSIKCSHWLQVSQVLAWKRVRSWAVAGMGWGWRKEQAGRWLAKEMTQLPPFCFHNLRHAVSAPSPRRASGRPRTPGHAGRSAGGGLPGPAPSAPTLPCRRSPEKGRSGDLAWLLGTSPGTRNLSLPGAPRRGSGAGSPETGPEAAPEPGLESAVARLRPARRRRPRARRHLRLPGHGRATPAARIVDRKAPSDH